MDEQAYQRQLAEAEAKANPLPQKVDPKTKAWQGVSIQLAQELANKLGGTYEQWLAWGTGHGPKPTRKEKRNADQADAAGRHHNRRAGSRRKGTR